MWQKPDRVISALDLRPGQRVADLGAGSGYFTFKLAKAVYPHGRVWAVDTDEKALESLQARARANNIDNIKIVRAQADNPTLTPKSLDLVFIADTYHHIRHRTRYFTKLAAALRPRSRVAIIDFDRHSFSRRTSAHAIGRDVILGEMKRAGYSLLKEYHFLSKQNFLIFTLKSHRAN